MQSSARDAYMADSVVALAEGGCEHERVSSTTGPGDVAHFDTVEVDSGTPDEPAASGSCVIVCLAVAALLVAELDCL